MTVMMTALPLHERPRERLFALGVEALTERELLALVLRNGTSGVSALDLASELLADFGSLQALGTALPEELAGRRGLGSAKASAVIAALQLGRRASQRGDVAQPPVLRCPADVAAVAKRSLATLRRERVVVLVCDGANRLRQTVVVSDGSIDKSLVPVREILNAVLRNDGRAFALAHNHPAGDVDPSDADRQATDAVRAAAKVAGLRFLGHVVVAADDWCNVS